MAHHTLFIFVFLVIFVSGAFLFTAFNNAILKLGKFQTKEILKNSIFLGKHFLLEKNWEIFYLIISVTKHILYLLFAISALLFIDLLFFKINLHTLSHILYISLSILLFFLFIDLLARFIAKKWPRIILKYFAFLSSIYILFFLALTLPFLILFFLFYKKLKKEPKESKKFFSKSKVLEMIKDSELSTILSPADQNTIASMITFKEKVTREIMIPRVDIFALSSKTSLKDACLQLLQEDYSRIPVFDKNLDDIVGVLMYKDLLKIYTHSQENKDLLDQPIKNILKPVIYAPENKKISKLFQEFINKKIHLAIIVNEYGGTEGIVTIEDILEEIVGEIKDEYDIGEEKQFLQLPSGEYIIDAKMSIIDLEKELQIKIPHSFEYETIGGYIFHIAGTIPTKGWKIHLEDFDIEVLVSTERCIEKIKITILNK